MNHSSQSGQAAVVLVLVVSIVVLMFSHVTAISFSDVQVSDEFSEGEFLQMKAEGYLEDGALHYLRDINYTGESLIDGDYSCTITITDIGGLDRDFETECSKGDRSRVVGMQANYNTGVFSFTPIEQR